jgi:hypothetical protein
MNSIGMIIMLVFCCLIHQHLGRLIRLLNYTHIREEMRPLRGIRLVMAGFIITYAVLLIRRHIDFVNLEFLL